MAIYLFDLPFYRFLQGWGLGVVIVNALFAVGIYAINFALGGFQFTLSPTLRAHLSALGIIFFLLLAIGYWLSLQELLYSARGAAYGAAYTDVAVRIPALNVLIVISIIVAIVLAANAFPSVAEPTTRRHRRLVSCAYSRNWPVTRPPFSGSRCSRTSSSSRENTLSAASK